MLPDQFFQLGTISYRPDRYAEPHTDGRPHQRVAGKEELPAYQKLAVPSPAS